MFVFEYGNVRNVGIYVLGGVTVSLNIVYFIVITIRNKYLCNLKSNIDGGYNSKTCR